MSGIFWQPALRLVVLVSMNETVRDGGCRVYIQTDLSGAVDAYKRSVQSRGGASSLGCLGDTCDVLSAADKSSEVPVDVTRPPAAFVH